MYDTGHIDIELNSVQRDTQHNDTQQFCYAVMLSAV
jgi:hypothetical protein